MSPLEVVVGEEAIEIALDLVDFDVPGLSPLDAEALVEQRAVHALHKTVGARASHLGVAMLDVFQGKEQLDGKEVYRVESIPKPEAAVVWGKILYRIASADHLPVIQEYYDERGELVKVLKFSELRTVGGRTIPTRWEMQPVRKPQNKTVFVIKEIAFDQALDPNTFTLQNLQRVR